MMNHKQRIEFEIEDAEVHVDGHTFWNCYIEVIIEREHPDEYTLSNCVSGEIIFTHPVPKNPFFGEDDVPNALDVSAENDLKRIEIESLLMANKPDQRKLEFAAIDSHQTIFGEDERYPDYLHEQSYDNYCLKHQMLYVKNALGTFMCPFCAAGSKEST